jgi:membrane protein implicated in regulation of membrane protease activity
MTLFELLFFLLVCLVAGFIAHLIFPAWGWWVGAVPALALVLVLEFFTFRNLFSDDKNAKRRRESSDE